ncbi:MAG: hypothetical protein M3O34_08690 [Chloroflexota bacterium]|nr:hypothetical protein [Chloroflexota bacterium]
MVIGHEVPLGNGYADLLAVEPTGRVAIIEVKLARNAEARRAVVSQVLAYAAYLAGTDPGILQRDLVGRYLRDHGHETLPDAVAAADQEGSFDQEEFSAGLTESLGSGRFRLVLVLDAAPDELVRLVGYLESVTGKIVVDLVVVSAYDIGGSRVIVPQRVEPERQSRIHPVVTTSKSTGRLVDGSADFVASIESAQADQRPTLRKLTDWAETLDSEGLVRLSTYHGTSGRLTLLPRLRDEDAGLVTIWNDRGAYLSLWRSVFMRRSPKSIERVEAIITPKTIGNGNVVRQITDDLLAALHDAYREAIGMDEGQDRP